MIFQKTLKDVATVRGIGIHSGQPATLKIKPARPNHGIAFLRTDVPSARKISAHYKNITNTQLATTLGKGPTSISTVEHVMAALQGAGVDNALVEVDGPEVPIMDGSAIPFYTAIVSVGLQSQMQARPYLFLRRKVELKMGEKWAVAEPSHSFEVMGSIEFDHPAIGYQEFHYREGKTSFLEIADARTFGFVHEVEALKRMGLARGGSFENAVVLDSGRVLNPEGLRYTDEFIRHKVMDALGDFKLAGISMRASIRLHRAGHDLHSKLLEAVFRNPENFEIVDGSVRDEAVASQLNAVLAGAAAG